MAIIFVHGVNTRLGPSYDAGILVKQAFLGRSLKGATVNGCTFGSVIDVVFPYWGDLGADFAWEMASLPQNAAQVLGTLAESDLRAFLASLQVGVGYDLTEEPLLALSRYDFSHAMETLTMLVLDQTSIGLEAEVAEFVVTVQNFAANDPPPGWLYAINSDQQLLANLSMALRSEKRVQSQGIDRIVNALSMIGTKIKQTSLSMLSATVDRAGDYASSTRVLRLVRESLNATLGRFLGDVFVYLGRRGDKGAPGAIPKRILAAFDESCAATPTGEPLVVIGHSLGAVIIFDLLTHFRPGLQVDLFVSVGSQVAHFEEIKLYKWSDPAVRLPLRAETPSNIRRWINIYDEADILSYSADNVFDRVDVDSGYDTRTFGTKAHSAYFEQARFYAQLRAHIDKMS